MNIFSKFYSWLDDQCDKHNSKLTYVDWKEYWHPFDYLLSIILYSVLLPCLFISMGILTEITSILVLGIILFVFSTAWHIWHLFFY